MIHRLPPLGSAVRFLTLVMLLCLPFSTALRNISEGLLLLAVLFSREFWTAAPTLWRLPLVRIVILMLALILIGTLYTSASAEDAWYLIKRYQKLLLLALLLPFFQDGIAGFSGESMRLRAMRAFAVSITALLACSLTDYWGWTHIGHVAFDTPPGDAVFISHITQAYLFAILIALTVPLAWASPTRNVQLIWLGVATITAADIMIVMYGRTGKLVLPLVVIWLVWEWLRTKRVPRRTLLTALGGVACTLAAALALMTMLPGSPLGQIFTEIHDSKQSGKMTSQGGRIEFYQKSLSLIRARPWTGYGTGSMLTETRRLAAHATTEVGRVVTINPHNEFLMWGVQFGLPGVLLFSAFCMAMIRAAWRTPALSGVMLRGIVLVFVSGCIVNSYLWDAIEGHALMLALGILLPLNPGLPARDALPRT